MHAKTISADLHGSYTVTSQNYLDIVSTSDAIICAGEINNYGHPHEITI